MSRVYFEGWYNGAYVKAEDWYKDNLVYVNVRQYIKSTATSRPDIDKSFLLKVDDPNRLCEYDHTIADALTHMDEQRDGMGNMKIITITLPKGITFSWDRYWEERKKRELTPEQFAESIND